MKKLTDLQKSYFDNLREGSVLIGSHLPRIKRTFDALVDKGYAIRTPMNGGWFRYTAK